MRDHLKEKKFVGLPFSIGCVSQSSVEVADDQHGKSQPESNPSPKSEGLDEMGNGGKSTAKNPLGFGFVPLQRLIKSFKDLSQKFSFREEDEEEDDGEMAEMEIGFPTDVQHVGHIGWDGTTSSLTNIKGCDGASTPASSSSQPYSFPSVYLRQFELAMAAHADASHHYV